MSTIILEYLEEDHLPELVKQANHPKVAATSGVPYPCDLDTVKTWVGRNDETNRSDLTFVILADGNIAGATILKKIDWVNLEAELAYWIGVQFWGKGIGTTAAIMMRDFAFEMYNFKRLNAHFLKHQNQPSSKILQKLGFEPDQSRPDLPAEGKYAHNGPDVWTFVTLPRETWFKKRTFKLQIGTK